MSDDPQRPTSDDRAAWKAYWTAQGMPWRTEPEIEPQRYAYLAERRAITPNIEQGIYPFRDENGSIKLDRADVEWLLVTHESGGTRGPVDWADVSQMQRQGLDLRGADLQGINLARLPLTRVRCGLTLAEYRPLATPELTELAATRLERANLREVDLVQAQPFGSHLENSGLSLAHLEGACLIGAHLEGADLFKVHFEGVSIPTTNPQASGPRSVSTTLAGPADLRFAYFDAATGLDSVVLGDKASGSVPLADVRWGGVNLARIDWAQVRLLGDEREARSASGGKNKPTDMAQQLSDFKAAVRANRQLATVLRNQGLNEDADRFVYRAQVLQRQVLRRQGRSGREFGSWVLDMVSGYGYKPMRSVIAYLLIICLFAGGYLLNAQFAAPHLSWDEALVLSISSFHGRGFFSSGISLGDTLARLAAVEAIIGLLIEITFIATFTQRFFAR